jgi:DNA-binding Lrp family transcriptional regulator
MAEHTGAKTAYAYVLINVDPAETATVVERLGKIPNAKVREVMGPYDIIVELQADASEYIGKILREKIRPIKGVQNTVTCIWLES